MVNGPILQVEAAAMQSRTNLGCSAATEQRQGSSPARRSSGPFSRDTHAAADDDAGSLPLASPSRQLPLRSPRKDAALPLPQQRETPFATASAGHQHPPAQRHTGESATSIREAQTRKPTLLPNGTQGIGAPSHASALPMLKIPSLGPPDSNVSLQHHLTGALSLGGTSPLLASMMASLQDMQAGGMTPGTGRTSSPDMMAAGGGAGVWATTGGITGGGTEGSVMSGAAISPGGDFSAAAAAAVRRRQKLREAASKVSAPPPPLLVFESSLGMNSKVKGMLNDARSVSDCLRHIEKNLLPVAHSRKR